nr:hypothetical protein [Tanacetum cinerariifolium]
MMSRLEELLLLQQKICRGNLLKQQYGNFKAEGSETLEQTFNRLQVIVSQLQFMDVEVKKDDLNQKFLTSLAPEWLMHTIVWSNRNDLDTMSLDDLYNNLKFMKLKYRRSLIQIPRIWPLFLPQSTTAEMKMVTLLVFPLLALLFPLLVLVLLQSAKTLLVPILLLNLMVLRSNLRTSTRLMKTIWKKWTLNGAWRWFDKSKVKCFNCHKMGHFARECRAPRSQERGRKENYRQGSKAEEKTPNALMAIDGVGWDWSYMVNKREDHALVGDAEAPTELALMANTESKAFDNSLCSNDCKKNNDSLNKTLKLEKDGVDGKLAGLLKSLENLDNLIESQRSDKVKDGVGYNAVPPPA